ncbi:MAG: class I SAM-dependent methyltransferase [Oligoflexia bacterium]|nr:class I SAM-dependent methyltransferase [Oligoflexia bacterium]
MIEYKIDKVILHPLSIKALKSGHPHITKDQYSEKFPSKSLFLYGISANANKDQHPICLFLHDPEHKKIKGRVWSWLCANTGANTGANTAIDFLTELNNRICSSFEKRIKLNISNERENFYLIFAEADQIPGVFVIHLGEHILIQIYCFFWRSFENKFLELLKQNLKKIFPNKTFHFHLKYREQNKGNKGNNSLSVNAITPMPSPLSLPSEKFIINEFEIKYQIDISNLSDIGLYTDMASIRKRLIPYLKLSKNLLNLFCYTGAFSLLALKHLVKQVTSVDLSAKYLQLLDENYQLNKTNINTQNFDNKNFDSQNCENQNTKHTHVIINQSVSHMITHALKKQNHYYDFVIIDPPSCSNDKNKTSSAMQMYKELLPNIIKLIANDGYLLMFINNHQISFNDFKTKISIILKALNSINTHIVEEFRLSQDCPTLKNFPEGDYIKGLLLQIKERR